MSVREDDLDVRHLAVRGGRDLDVVVPADVTIGALLEQVGVRVPPTSRVIRDRAGEAVDPASSVAALTDGESISVVDGHVADTKQAARARRARDAPEPSLTAAWWFLALSVGLAVVLAALMPDLRPPAATAWVAAALVAAAGVSGVLLVVRGGQGAGVAAVSPALAFAGGVLLLTRPGDFSPTVAAATAAVAFGTACGALAVLARDAVVRTELVTLAVIAVSVGVVFAAAALLSLPPASACAVVMGAVPVALRAVPASVMDVPPGMFIDFAAHQETRWAVREQLPDTVDTVDRSRVKALVARSGARLRVADVALAVVAVAAAPVVYASFDAADLVVFIGKIVLGTCVVLALVLAGRRLSSRVLRWTVRAAGAAIGLVLAAAAASLLPADARIAVAAVALALGIGCALLIGLIVRGARSLYWSRFADGVEALAVALSLPAALVAAGVIDLLRGL